MRRFWKYIVLVFACVSGVFAGSEYSYQGLVSCDGVQDDDVQVLGLDASVYVELKLGLLLGEPLRSAKGIVAVDGNRASKFSTRYKGRRFSVPRDVVEQISVISCMVRGNLDSDASIDFDLGAMSDIYWGSGGLIENWSREQQEDFFSFNVSGSPNWDQFIYTGGRGIGLGDAAKKTYLTEADAKEFFSKGMNLVKLDSDAEIDFNLNPVKFWIEEQIRKEKAEKKEADKEGEEETSEEPENPFAVVDADDPFGADPFAADPFEDNPFEKDQAELVVNSVPSQVEDRTLRISGKITNMTVLEDGLIQLDVNGSTKTVAISADGSFSTEVSLDIGNNRMELVFQNSNKKRSSQTIFVRRKEPPVVATYKSEKSSKSSSRKRRSSSSRSREIKLYYTITGERTFSKDGHFQDRRGETESTGTVISKGGRHSSHPYLKEVTSTFTVYYKPDKTKRGRMELMWTEYAIVECVFKGIPLDCYSEKDGCFEDKDDLKDYTVDRSNKMYGSRGRYYLRY